MSGVFLHICPNATLQAPLYKITIFFVPCIQFINIRTTQLPRLRNDDKTIFYHFLAIVIKLNESS